MKIAIASGKGGTGKTTVAVNLAWMLGRMNECVRYLDCDVEEPNGHLFLNPVISKTETAGIPVPVIDESKCAACGECVRFCQYRALVRLGKIVMVFPELCHGCGGCMLICPHKAITEQNREIGSVEIGMAGKADFVQGRLNVGEAMSPPLIRKVLEHATDDAINIIDAPPGTSCPVITSVRNADFTVLVTEPTPFGLNDLGLALDMVCDMAMPHGVVVNRTESKATSARDFCEERGEDILAEIPDDRRIAEVYSSGKIICDALPVYERCFSAIWTGIRKRIQV